MALALQNIREMTTLNPDSLKDIQAKIQKERGVLVKMGTFILGMLGVVLLLSRSSATDPELPTKEQFEKLMQTVADGWNEGNARKAADCFAEDAVYLDPPDRQVYRGREELFRFFGGNEGRKEPMKMTWHHLTFNESTGIGSGEFTFEYGSLSHGVVIVRIDKGKIQNWREYYYETSLGWDEFTKHNPF